MDKGIVGIIDHAKKGYNEDGAYSYCVYFLAVDTKTEIWTHFHAFESAEDAEKALKVVMAKVSAHTNDSSEVDVGKLTPDCWSRSPKSSLEERWAEEAMWEVKDAIAEGYGHHITPDVMHAVGLA